MVTPDRTETLPSPTDCSGCRRPRPTCAWIAPRDHRAHPDARLVYHAPISSRSKSSIAAMGVLDGYAGCLVRDDYAGWFQFDTQLAGVQQCATDLSRHAKGVLELCTPPSSDGRAIIDVLREAAAAVAEAITHGREQLDPNYWPTCVNAATTWSAGASRSTATATGPRATTRTQPGYTSPQQGRTGLELHPRPRRALGKQRQRGGSWQPRYGPACRCGGWVGRL